MLFNMFQVLMMSPPAQGGEQPSIWPTILMFGAIIVIFYFLLIRPQQKRQKEQQKMIESIKKGDKVITLSGIHGTVTDMDDKTMVLQIADNVKVRFERSAIASKA